MDAETQITYLLIAHLLTNVIFFVLNIFKNTTDEIDPDAAIATKTELTIHCIISVLALFFIFLAASPDSDLSWFAILIGFCGILIILKPGTSMFSLYSIYPIFFCIGFAASAILIKLLSIHYKLQTKCQII